MTTVQCRLVLGRKDERIDGPDDADVVVVVAAADAALDPAVAFMSGRLKATGSTGALFEAFRSGAVRTALSRLAG